MKIGFPQDRALVTATAERSAATTVLAFPVIDSQLLGFKRETAKAIAFATLLVFFRKLQTESLCVKFRLIGTLQSGVQQDHFATANFASHAMLQMVWEAMEIAREPKAGVAELELLICEIAEMGQVHSQPEQQAPVLCYFVQDQQLHLTLHFHKHLLAPITASDFLEKIGLVLAALAGQEVAVNALALGTASSNRFIPDITQPILARSFETLATTFFDVAERHAEQPAIVGNDLTYSYVFLKNQTIALMNGLVDAGVAVGDVVAIRGASSPGTIASMLAVLGVGAVVVTIDPLLPEERRNLITEISKPRFTIEVLERKAHKTTQAQTISTEAWPDPQLLQAVLQRPLVPAAPHASAYIFFTSGSSGVPKGVLGTHLGLSHFLDWQRSAFPIGPGHRTAQLTALSFDVVLRDLFYPLTSGACIHIPRRETLLDARKMLAWIASVRITAMHCVPSLMRAWLMADTGQQPFQYLQTIFFAGEPLTDALLRRFKAAAGEATCIINLYGPTETTLAKLYNRIERVEEGVQPLGKPQPGVDLLIFKDRQTLCGLWETGEIAIRTPYRSNGYFQNPELTREVFVPNPLRADPDDLIYFTGDLGRYRSDGKVEIFGRIDAQIKIRGVRIEPHEIESCILSLPGMKDAAVTTRVGASGDKILLAVVVPESFENFDLVQQAQQLREKLKQRLHDAMVPARILYQESLPYLPNGKLDRKSIAGIDFGSAGTDSKTLAVPELDAKLGRVIAEIEEVLGVQIRDMNHSFVDLGGDSLSYIRISFVIEDAYGTLPLGWELTPLGELGASMGAHCKPKDASSLWISMEPSILLRAFAILFVVVGHASQLAFMGTSTLFVISGISFGKFFRRDLFEKGAMSPVGRFIFKFGLPAALWQILAIATGAHSFWLPDLLLMGTYFHEPQGTHMTLWYLDVLAANLVMVSLLTVLFGRLSRAYHSVRPTFATDIALVLVGLVVSFLQVGTGIWDGALGLHSVAPFKWLWMLAFGIAVAEAVSVRQKAVLSLLLAGIALGQLAELPKIANSFGMLDPFFYISVMALIWLRRVEIPRFLRSPLIGIASASLFIYIVNYTVIQKTHRLFHFEGSWPLEVAAAVLAGVVASWAWSRLEVVVRRSFASVRVGFKRPEVLLVRPDGQGNQ